MKQPRDVSASLHLVVRVGVEGLEGGRLCKREGDAEWTAAGAEGQGGCGASSEGEVAVTCLNALLTPPLRYVTDLKSDLNAALSWSIVSRCCLG